MSSYRQILTTLGEAQEALQIVADKTQHFLHETLREIATRLRESHTMTTFNTVTQLMQGQPADAAAPSIEPNKAQNQNEISPDLMAEIANTPITKSVAEHKNTFKPRPSFMHSDAEEFNHQKQFNPKPGSM